MLTRYSKALDALGSTAGNPEEDAVKKLESSMKHIARSLTQIHNIIGSMDEAQRLQKAMVERYEGILSGMEQASTTIQARKTAQPPPHIFIIVSSRAFFFLFQSAERISRASLRVAAQREGPNYPLCSLYSHCTECLRCACSQVGEYRTQAPD